jgi:hypothetical protein
MATKQQKRTKDLQELAALGGADKELLLLDKIHELEDVMEKETSVLGTLDKVRGKDGKDGRDGKDGAQGPRGVQGIKGPKGDKGDAGKDGKDGKDGVDGKDGRDGVIADLNLLAGKVATVVNKLRGDQQLDARNLKNLPDAAKEVLLTDDVVAEFRKKIGFVPNPYAGGSGATFLSSMRDVNKASVQGATNNQVLAYNSTTKKWEAQTNSSGGFTMGDTITGGTDTRVLFNDGNTVGEDAEFTYNKTTNALTVDLATIHTPETNSIIIGTVSPSLSSAVSNTFLGINAGAALVGGDFNTAMGKESLQSMTGGGSNTSIGSAAGSAITTGSNNTLLGRNAGNTLLDGDENVVIGSQADVTSETNGSIVIGASATATADNQLVMGSEATFVTDVYIGEGVTTTTPADITYHGSDASGTDVAGADMILQPSRGTGTGVGGDFVVKYTPAGTTGSSLNAAAEGLTIAGADGRNSATGFLNSAASGGEVLFHNHTLSLATSGTQSGTDYFASGGSLNLTGTGNMTADVTNNAIWAANGGAVKTTGTHTFNTPIVGTAGKAMISGGATLTNLIGMVGVGVDAGAGTVTNMMGVLAQNIKAGGSTITNIINYGSSAITGACTNAMGVNVAAATGGTNNFGILIDAMAGTNTSNFGIDIGNVSGAAVNYAIRTGTGIVDFGDDTNITGDLDVTGNITTQSGGNLTLDGTLRVNGAGASDVTGDFNMKASATVADDLQEAQGANTAATTNLSLGQTGNAFKITGTTTIDSLSDTAWQDGSRVMLYFSNDITVTNAAAGLTGDDRQIVLQGGRDMQAQDGDVLVLRLMTNVWVEQSRQCALEKYPDVTASTHTPRNTSKFFSGDCASNAITFNLPTAASCQGHEFTFVKTDSGVNTVTIDGNGSETINGATTQTLSNQYDSMTIWSDGDEWFIKAQG